MNQELISEHLTTPCDLLIFDELDSSNSFLKRHLEQHGSLKPALKCERPLAVIAETQSAGKGRLGRTWKSPRGGLYLSLLFQLSVPSERLGALSLIVASALRGALSRYVTVLDPGTPATSGIHIKWPNDILGQSADRAGKLAGILVETGTNSEQLIIGVGINITRSDKDADEKAFFLSDLPLNLPNLSRELVAAQAINALSSYIGVWKDHSFSFKPFKAAYLDHLVLKGQDVVVRQRDGRIIVQGVVQGVDENGYLLVCDSSGGAVLSVAVGDVTLRDS